VCLRKGETQRGSVVGARGCRKGAGGVERRNSRPSKSIPLPWRTTPLLLRTSRACHHGYSEPPWLQSTSPEVTRSMDAQPLQSAYRAAAMATKYSPTHRPRHPSPHNLSPRAHHPLSFSALTRSSCRLDVLLSSSRRLLSTLAQTVAAHAAASHVALAGRPRASQSDPHRPQSLNCRGILQPPPASRATLTIHPQPAAAQRRR